MGSLMQAATSTCLSYPELSEKLTLICITHHLTWFAESSTSLCFQPRNHLQSTFLSVGIGLRRWHAVCSRKHAPSPSILQSFVGSELSTLKLFAYVCAGFQNLQHFCRIVNVILCLARFLAYGACEHFTILRAKLTSPSAQTNKHLLI